MNELDELLSAHLKGGERQVLATVVSTSGSTYRRAGAKMLVTSTGRVAGSVSGGCLENDLLNSAWARTEEGPTLVTYNSMNSDEDIVWGFGLGCNGIVTVLLERVPANDPYLGFVRAARAKEQSLTVVTQLSSSGVGVRGAFNRETGERFGESNLAAWLGEEGIEDSGIFDWKGEQLFVEQLLPRPKLLIVGAGFDAAPLAAIAALVGWKVDVADWRASALDSLELPSENKKMLTRDDSLETLIQSVTYQGAVVMTHNYLRDQAYLTQVLSSQIEYVGQLGPSRRTQRILDEARGRGFIFSDEQIARLHSPVGLSIGAEGAEEIALSIMSQIKLYFSSKTDWFVTRIHSDLRAEKGSVACSISAL